MGAFNRGSDNLVGEGEPERLESATLTAEVIPLLGTRPLLGRAFTPEEDRDGAPGTLLLSYGLWQERFAGDPGVLGRKLLLDDEPYLVIGVMPRGFHFPRRETRLWRPMRLESAAFERRDDLGSSASLGCGRASRSRRRGRRCGSWRRSSSGSTRERTRGAGRTS